MDFLIILLLILLNGAFAMSELAVASSRKSRLQRLADDGDKGAAAAVKLMEDPTEFLSSVQVGITSIGVLNGIVGEAAFSGDLSDRLFVIGLERATADIVATGIVVTVITFLTIVFGELVPKRIGQLFPEPVARFVALPMTVVATVAHPFVQLLSATTHFFLKLLRVKTDGDAVMTTEEIEESLAEGLGAGVIEVHEHQMVRNVFALDTRSLGSIMLPRADIHWLDAADTVDTALQKARALGHSWYPVCKGGLDNIVGVLHVSEMLRIWDESAGKDAVGGHVTPAVYVPETLNGMELLQQYRVAAMRMVFVVDEYGVVQGLLTPRDLLEAITGELKSEEARDTWATQREDGSWDLDGAMPASELKVRLGFDELPDEDKGRFNTLAGLLQYVSGELLSESESVMILTWEFTIQHMEGRRIDRVHAVNKAGPPELL
jgi:putative hemolysin